MNEITLVLDGHIENKAVCGAIKAALSIGKDTLKRYYSKTDASEVYPIATSMSIFTLRLLYSSNFCFIVLHPAYKVEYFNFLNLEKDWIHRALTVLRVRWLLSYKSRELS